MDESKRMCLPLYKQLIRSAERDDFSMASISARKALDLFCDETERRLAQEIEDADQEYKNNEINILKSK